MNEELRREIILDNYKEPFHKGLVEDNDYHKANSKSDSCIDNLDFMLKVEDGIIKDIRFDGEACAISTSASSLLIQNLIGKKKEDALEILKQYQNMINEKEFNKDVLNDLNVYDEIYKQPNRKNCALIPSNALNKLLEEFNNESIS